MNEIESFLDRVCDYVSYKRLHKALKKELTDHLEDLILEYEKAGMDTQAAVEKAIEQMGNPEEIGKGFNQVHQPQRDWWMISLIGAVVLLGGFVFLSLTQDPASLPLGYAYPRYLVYMVLGIGLGIGCSLIDYTRFEKKALLIYIGALVLLMLTVLSPYTVNGRKYFVAAGFTFAPASIILPVLLLAYAGLLKRWGRGSLPDMLKLIALMGAAVLLNLIQYRFSEALLVGCGLLMMLTVTILSPEFRGNRGLYLGTIYAGGIGGFVLYLAGADYRIVRLLALINRQLDPEGSGYIYRMLDGVYRQAKWMGKSEGLYLMQTNAAQQFAIPEVSTDMVFTYLVGAFGWLAGFLVILAFVGLAGRMLIISRRISNPVNRSVAAAILVVFVVQVAGNILMNIGFLPITSLSLPFISYGGTNFIMNMMLLGIFLGIQRRKHLVLSGA